MKYMLAMLLLFSIGASAQIQVDSMIVKQKLKLNGYQIKRVSRDTSTSNQDSTAIMTEAATKQMVLGRSSSRDAQIAAKMNSSDSASMLSAYQSALNARLRYIDTAALLAAYRTALNARLKFTDTSAMLSAYITALVDRVKYSDTASMLTAYRSALLARMNYTDTTGMLAAYQSAINARLRSSDTAAILAAYQAALSARQVTLVSGTNIKTINGSSVLGSGNLTVSGGLLGSGLVSSTLVPLAVWSVTNSTLSNSPNILYDTVIGKLYVSNSQQSINGFPNAITYNPFTVASSYINNNNRLMIFNGPSYSAIQSYLSSNSSAMPTIINPYGGFVNIGTTDNPSRQLQVINANDYQFRLGYSSSFYYDMGRYGSDGYLHFYGAQSGADGYVFAGASGTKVIIASNGNTSISGNLTSTQYRLSSLNTAPISSTDTGTTGEIRFVAGFLYLCTSTNTWVRSSFSSF